MREVIYKDDVVKEFIKLFGCIQDVSDIDEWEDICQTIAHKIPSIEIPTNTPIDLINRAYVIEAVELMEIFLGERKKNAVVRGIQALPSDVVSLEDAMQIRNTILFKEYMRGRRDAEVVQSDGRNNIKRYPNCQMRTSLGNCDAIGGFCTSVNAPICDAFHKLVEAAQGEWILVCDSEGEGDNLYRCSKCGCEYGCQEYDKPNFCPNCGARMYREDGEA